MKMVMTALLSVTMLAACSKDDSKKGGTKVSALTTEQQAKFNKTLDATYILSKSTTEIKDQKSNGRKNTATNAQAKASSSGLNQKADELKFDMESNCQIEMKNDETNNNPGEINFDLSITGTKCPVSASISQKTSMDMNSGHVKSKASQKLVVKDAKLKKDLDIQETAYNIGFNVDDNGINGELNGYIQTNESGKITLSGNIKSLSSSENEMKIQQITELQYPDFKISLNVVSTSVFKNNEQIDTKVCQLNNQEISEKECNEILLKLGLDSEEEKEQQDSGDYTGDDDQDYPNNDGEIEFP